MRQISFHSTHLLIALVLASLALAVPIDIASEYTVKELPGLSSLPAVDQPVMHAGHIELDAETDTNYFFWRFAKPAVNETTHESSDAHNKLIVWLNGGPGCSSMDGALMEIGPLRIGADGKVKYNKGTWMEAAELLFVDQPGGTGFSYTNKYDTELDQVAADFVVFLKKYYSVFPADLEKQLYIAGESYAGQYIPYITRAILDENKKDKPAYGTKLDLRGALIGNGWISPDHQSLSYIPFAVAEGLVSERSSGMDKLLKQHEQCQKLLNNREKDTKVESPQCDAILDTLLEITKDSGASSDQQCLNMYDYRLRDSYPSCGMNWPGDLDFVRPFLRGEKIGEYLNLKKTRVWEECDGKVGRHLRAKHSVPSIEMLPQLLAEVPILLFNCDKDIICNYMGTEAMINDMYWDGAYGMDDDTANSTFSADWYYATEAAGLIKSRGNLTYTRVYGTSHMVPFDKPAVSRGLFDIMHKNYKPVHANHSSGVETPIYKEQGYVVYSHDQATRPSTPANSTAPASSPKAAIADRSWAFYAFVFTVILIMAYAARYFYKSMTSKQPSSILAKYTKMNSDGFSRGASPDTGVTGGLLKFNSGKKKSVRWLDEVDNTQLAQDESVLGRVLNKFGYGETAGRSDDIELNDTANDQFIIQEEDEEFDARR